MKNRTPNSSRGSEALPSLVGRLLCGIGIHDYRVVEVTGGFGPGGSVEKRECRRCQNLSVRRAP